MKSKYTIEQIRRGINKALELHWKGEGVRKAEKPTGVMILHRIFPIVKRYYLEELRMDKLPKKVGRTEAQILFGKLRESELDYYKRVKERERGQTSLKDFGGKNED